MATPNFREGPSGRSDLDIRADHIASMDSFYEPARTNNYLVIIGFPPAMRGNVGAGIPGTQNGGGANENVEILTKSNLEASLPSHTVDTITIPWWNQVRKVTSVPSVEDGSFNFVDYIDKPVAQLLYQWSLSVYNPRTGQIGLARNLKGTIEIRQYTPDGNVAHGNASFKASNPSRTWLLKGAWPKSVKFGDFSYESSDINKIEVTFRYDKGFLTQIGNTQFSATDGISISPGDDPQLGPLYNIAASTQ